MSNQIKYCTKCGSKLEIKTTSVSHYDPTTGIAIFKAHLYCPNQKHWWDGHTFIKGTCVKEDIENFEPDMLYD